MNYYYIVIDTLQKTLEIFPASTCQATTEKAIAAAKFGIDNLTGIQSIQFNNRFRLIFNGTSNTIDFSKDSYALLDWGRGVWTYKNTWYWSAGMGKINGKKLWLVIEFIPI